jgi:hypothetical protein
MILRVNKAALIFGSLAVVLTIWAGISIIFFPNNVKEEDITAPRVIAAKNICKEIPVPESFTYLSSSWNLRTGGSAHYSNLYKTTLTFDEILEFYKPILKEKGFEGGNWRQSTYERQISFGKNNINVIIAYKTHMANLWELLKKDNWNVYIHCDDRKNS